jgi:iron(III) transport system substrate-binding protein
MGHKRRTFLKSGIAITVGTAVAGCSGDDGGNGDNGSDGDDGSDGDSDFPDVEVSSEAEDYANDLPDYYPDEYDRIIQAAMDEGQITYYTSQFGSLAESLINRFNERYPFVDVEFISLPTATLVSRFASEAGQDEWNPDVIHNFDPPGLRLFNDLDLLNTYPQRSPEAEFYDDQMKSDDGNVIGAHIIPLTHAWNPDNWDETPPLNGPELVDAIESNPDQWNENLASYDALQSSTGWTNLFLWEQEYGEDQMLSMYETIGSANPRTFWSTSTMGEWVARGEVSYGMNLDYGIIQKFVLPDYDEDAIVSRLDNEVPFLDFGAGFCIPRELNNPNAAKLFFDWSLSAEGRAHITNEWWWAGVRRETEDLVEATVPIGPDEELLLTYENMLERVPEMLTYEDLAPLTEKQETLKNQWASSMN